MQYLDIQACLETMQIIVDTREQPTKRAYDRYSLFSCPYRRQAMAYGDYTYNFTYKGKKLYPEGVPIQAGCIIERKSSLEELSGNLTHDRERFIKELEKAADAGATVYLLIENGNIQKIYAGHYRTKFDKNAYFASFVAMLAKYHIQPIFCPAEISGRIIYEILYRELRIRIERGDYDEYFK